MHGLVGPSDAHLLYRIIVSPRCGGSSASRSPLVIIHLRSSDSPPYRGRQVQGSRANSFERIRLGTQDPLSFYSHAPEKSMIARLHTLCTREQLSNCKFICKSRPRAGAGTSLRNAKAQTRPDIIRRRLSTVVRRCLRFSKGFPTTRDVRRSTKKPRAKRARELSRQRGNARFHLPKTPRGVAARRVSKPPRGHRRGGKQAERVAAAASAASRVLLLLATTTRRVRGARARARGEGGTLFIGRHPVVLTMGSASKRSRAKLSRVE